MKAVLLAVRPEFCELILSGKKTLEIRKSKPKLVPPFRVYIYCTKGDMSYPVGNGMTCHSSGGMAVVGEFICDNIRSFDVPYPAYQKELDKAILEQSCLTYYQLHRYAYHDELYAWHISDVKIYERHRSVRSFPANNCCQYHGQEGCSYPYHCFRAGKAVRCVGNLTRPPQSWCYVEELNGE